MTTTETHARAVRAVWAIGESGRTALEVVGGVPAAPLGRPDVTASDASRPGVEVRAASVRGLIHRACEEPRQDAYAIGPYMDDGFVAVVCDGVGSRAGSHLAADWLAQDLASSTAVDEQSLSAQIEAANGELLKFVHPLGGRAEMATTFALARVRCGLKGWDIDVAWSDDSDIWLLHRGGWTRLSTPDQAMPSRAIERMFPDSVIAFPHEDPRYWTKRLSIPQGAVFVMSDGVGTALAASAEVQEKLSEVWTCAPDCLDFARQVGFARKQQMDDRAVVGMWLDDTALMSPSNASDEVGAGGNRI